MNVGFFLAHFTDRGTDVATYDYAHYNETILKNNSYIICFTLKAQERAQLPADRTTYDKFKLRFKVIEIEDINEMANVIAEYNLNIFYTQAHGGTPIYQFGNKHIWQNCKTIKHCVFFTTCPEGDFYWSISNYLNKRHNTNIPVVPYMVNLPDCDENLREQLNIPKDAIIIGRYGSKDTFNIQIAHDAIKEFLDVDKNVYFVFMNTHKFYEHSRVIYLDGTVDLHEKTKYINTCDAMIHARGDGETFGLAIAEFSSKNKPVITMPCGYLEHIELLGDKGILYHSKEELIDIFKNIKTIISSRTDWNAFSNYSPEKVMSIFSNACHYG